MANLTVQKFNRDGITPSFTAADVAGDSFFNNGDVAFHIKNGDVAAVTVTVNSVAKCSHGFDHDLDISIDAGEEKILGPFSANRFNDTERNVSVSYSAVTSVTVAAYRM